MGYLTKYYENNVVSMTTESYTITETDQSETKVAIESL